MLGLLGWDLVPGKQGGASLSFMGKAQEGVSKYSFSLPVPSFGWLGFQRFNLTYCKSSISETVLKCVIWGIAWAMQLDLLRELLCPAV